MLLRPSNLRVLIADGAADRISVVHNYHALDQPVGAELKHIDALKAHGGTVFQHPIIDEVTRRTSSARCADAVTSDNSLKTRPGRTKMSPVETR